MMLKRIHLTMIVIIKKGENVNNAGFDDVKKNSLNNDCQGCFNKHSKVKHCFKINSRSSKQIKALVIDY